MLDSDLGKRQGRPRGQILPLLTQGGEMSFGLRDEDWVEPDPEPIIKCRDCEFWERCPSGCEWGWCTDHRCEFTREDDEC